MTAPLSIKDLPQLSCASQGQHQEHRWQNPSRDWYRCPGRAITLDQAAHGVIEWFSGLHAQSVDLSTGRPGGKVKEEANEYYEDPCLEEGADVIIATIGSLYYLGHTLPEIAQAVADKMAINRQRRWAQNLDGTWSHVKEDE